MTEQIVNKVVQQQMVRTKLEMLLQQTHSLSRKKNVFIFTVSKRSNWVTPEQLFLNKSITHSRTM